MPRKRKPKQYLPRRGPPTGDGLSADAVSLTAGPLGDLPGFYFDSLRQKYFKGTAPPSASPTCSTTPRLPSSHTTHCSLYGALYGRELARATHQSLQRATLRRSLHATAPVRQLDSLSVIVDADRSRHGNPAVFVANRYGQVFELTSEKERAIALPPTTSLLKALRCDAKGHTLAVAFSDHVTVTDVSCEPATLLCRMTFSVGELDAVAVQSTLGMPRHFAVAKRDQLVLFDYARGQTLNVPAAKLTTAVEFFGDSETVVCGSMRGKVGMFDLRDADTRRRASVSLVAAAASVSSLVPFDDTHRLVVSSVDGHVTVRDLRMPDAIVTHCLGASCGGMRVRLTANELLLTIGSHHGRVYSWDISHAGERIMPLLDCHVGAPDEPVIAAWPSLEPRCLTATVTQRRARLLRPF